MKTVIYDGREIKTNLGGNYPFCDGNDKKTMRLCIKMDERETDEEMFERLARRGYSRITFYYTTTMVRGYYKKVAYVR